MRIVTWNMGCGPRSRYRKTHSVAWSYLLDELRPDVAFVQEALVANLDAHRADHGVIVCALDAGTAAGTAVIARGHALTSGPKIYVSPHTYVVTGEIATQAGALSLASVHVYPGKVQHKDLTRLVELLRDTFEGAHVLVGGDFNSARRFDVVYGGKRHARFFAAMDTAGLHDVHWGLHQREDRTFWGHQTEEAYQDDHFFITRSWASRVRSCTVEKDVAVRDLSDHVPVVLELELDAP